MDEGFIWSTKTQRIVEASPYPRRRGNGGLFKITITLIFIPFLLFFSPGNPTNKPSLEIRALLSQTQAAENSGQYETALEYGYKVETLALDIGDKKAAAVSFNHMSRIYHRLGYLDCSLDYAQRALKSFSEMKDNNGIAEAYQNIGNVYRTLRKSEQALEHYREALGILRTLGDKKQLVPIFIYIGNIYHEARQYDKAMNYYQKSRAIVEKLNLRMAQAGVLYSIATLYADKNEDLAGALDYGKKALDICKETGQKRNITILLCLMGKCQRKLKQYKKALDYLNQALEIAIESKNKDITENLYEEFYYLYLEMGSYNKAYEYFDKAKDIDDEILSKKQLMNIPKLWLRLKTEKNEKEIQQLKFKNDIQESKLRRQELLRKLLIAAVLLCFMLVLSAVFYYLYRVKKRAECLLKESERKLQEMNTAKDKLFSIIAHDLQSPLNGLLLSSAYLEKNYDAMKEEEIKDSLHHIHENTSHMARLLENLLVWAVAQLEKLEVEPETLDLHRLTEDTIELITSSAREKNIRLMSHINENTLVRADKRMVETIMRNLVSNAVKYSTSEGKVDISSRPSGNFIEVAVSDTGVGIPANKLDTLFQLGNHNSARGTAGERGIGLGMFLCKEFVEKHQGAIHVESHIDNDNESLESSRGTRVVFTLPSG